MLEISKKKSNNLNKIQSETNDSSNEVNKGTVKITMVNIFKGEKWAEWIKIYKNIIMNILETQNTLPECKNTLQRLSRPQTVNWISEFEDNRKISQ